MLSPKNLVTFSDYVRKVMDISTEKIPISSKIKKVTETKIFNSTLKLDEAREIINKLYQEFNKKIQIGGGQDKDSESEDDKGEESIKEEDTEETNIDKKEPYDEHKEEEKFNEYITLGEGKDLKLIGKKDSELARSWWENLGFILFSDYIEASHVEKYLKHVLQDKEYNMILIIRSLCEEYELDDQDPVCRIKDIKNSVRDVFREELDREDANRDLLLNEYTERNT